jgi:cytoskeletal protein CcmA (bactofilin family)
MFNKNDHSNSSAGKSSEGVSSINLIGAGTSVEGDIKSSGDIRIDGTVCGSVFSKAKVVVGSTGMIEGNINSANSDISGTVKGKVNVSELLFLKSTAKMTGDILTGKLVVEVGASFTGSCNMGPMIKDIKDGERQPAAELKEKTA